MAGKKGAGENTKKVAGNAQKAEAAAAKQAAKDRAAEAAEADQWSKGAKSSSKTEAAAAKKEEAAAKKAEKALLLAAEEASLPTKPKGGAKAPVKKSRGLDLSALDGYIPDKKSKSGFGPPPPANNKASAISASGIENALDALDITGSSADAGQVDRHPERRFKAAYTAFEERRLEEMKDEKGLRRNQKIDQIRKEFEKHPDNPFNQVAGKYNSTREELKEIAGQERTKTEARLTGQQGN